MANLNKDNLLITGARGFIGKATIRHFKLKFNIIATSSKSLKSNPNVRFIKIDSNFSQLSILKKIKIHYVITLHGKIDNSSQYEKILNDHYNFTVKLLNNINSKYLKKIIHIGSADEYGLTKNPIKEINKYKPNSNYGIIKKLTSSYVRKFSKKNNINYTILNVFLCYGINQKEPRLIPYLINSIKYNKIAIIRQPNLAKDFLYIEDLIKSFELILSSKLKDNIFNIGYGKQTKIRDILDYLSYNYGLKYKINSVNNNSYSQYPDINRIIKKLKWKPETPILKGIDLILKYNKIDKR